MDFFRVSSHLNHYQVNRHQLYKVKRAQPRTKGLCKDHILKRVSPRRVATS